MAGRQLDVDLADIDTQQIINILLPCPAGLGLRQHKAFARHELTQDGLALDLLASHSVSPRPVGWTGVEGRRIRPDSGPGLRSTTEDVESEARVAGTMR